MSGIIGTRVRKRREKLRLSQAKLADLLGHRKAYVERIEAEVRSTTIAGLVALSEALETTPNFLLGFTRRP